MSWVLRGVSYCKQLASRLSVQTVPLRQIDSSLLCVQNTSVLCSSVRHKTEIPPYKFPVQSPYKSPGPRRYGYRQKIYDGGPLPRGLSDPIQNLERYRPRNVWNRKRATFGQNDYIDILGDSNVRPVDLIKAPAWLRGFSGNELQRLVRRMKVEGHIIRQLYPTLHQNHWKRIYFLYKKYNKKRGKRI